MENITSSHDLAVVGHSLSDEFTGLSRKHVSEMFGPAVSDGNGGVSYFFKGDSGVISLYQEDGFDGREWHIGSGSGSEDDIQELLEKLNEKFNTIPAISTVDDAMLKGFHDSCLLVDNCSWKESADLIGYENISHDIFLDKVKSEIVARWLSDTSEVNNF